MRRIILLLALLLACSMALAKPALDDQVVDEANILSQETEDELRILFQEVEKNTTAQMAVVAVKNLEGIPIEEYALELAHNKLGNAEKDNGLLLLVAAEEREYRIEVGYGLEGILNDAKVGRIARENFVPEFQAGNYDEGILKASYALADVILGNADAYDDNKSNAFIWVFIALLIVIFLVIFISASRQQGQSGQVQSDSGKGRRIGWVGGLGGFGRGPGGWRGGGGGFGGGGSSGRY